MRMNKHTSNILFTQFQGLRKLSRLTFTLEDLQNWCHTLNLINGLEHGTAVLGNYLLQDYTICTPLSEMVVPSRIGVETGDLSVDFKSKVYSEEDDLTDARVLSPVEFNLMAHQFAACLRISNVAESKITELRKEKTVVDVLARAYVHELGLCRMSLKPYFPVALTQNFYKSGIYTESVDEMMSRWFQDTLVNFNVASN